ncbi:hypothetical protein POX_g09074 [Penicillium oxalicum]|uniref:hypothetical protein n=1 Tax=Penicillium oxalicum TaxID=69781 RepID=UPI0020B6D96E|nr:hypothetical protein POX_g09074 [Penicillium oxalicum]KAI2786686.1 hypothetical protein POX_g09074 [Penicillium oxalicum]
MSAFNPFRVKNADGSSASATKQLQIAGKDVQPGEFFKPLPPLQQPRPHSHSASTTQTPETEASNSSTVNIVNPFGPDPSTDDPTPSAAEDGSSIAPVSFPSPSADGLSAGPLERRPSESVPDSLPLSSPPGQVSSSDRRENNSSSRVSPTGGTTQRPRSLLEAGTNTSSSGRSSKDKKPPPPPRNHHGRKISTIPDSATAMSKSAALSPHPSPSRSNHRFSYHVPSPEGQKLSVHHSDMTNSRPSSEDMDHFSPTTSTVESPQAPVPDSDPPANPVHRSGSQRSQRKRPPTPPISRRQSQIGRGNFSQSKPSGGLLVLSPLDSETLERSRPPSPGPSARSPTPSAADRKRFSMPPIPPAKAYEKGGESRLPGAPLQRESLSPTPAGARSNALSHNRRASSYNVPMSSSSSSSSVPPPPPPPRRARDPSARSSEGRPASQVSATEEVPLPQPSNATDILADLTRLQKEVDDLRGHYENRKVSP